MNTKLKKILTFIKYLCICFLISYGILAVMYLMRLSIMTPKAFFSILQDIIRMPFSSVLGAAAFLVFWTGSLVCTYLSYRSNNPQPDPQDLENARVYAQTSLVRYLQGEDSRLDFLSFFFTNPNYYQELVRCLNALSKDTLTPIQRYRYNDLRSYLHLPQEAEVKSFLSNYHYPELSCLTYSDTLDVSRYAVSGGTITDYRRRATAYGADSHWFLCYPKTNMVIGVAEYTQIEQDTAEMYISLSPALYNSAELPSIMDACLRHCKLHAHGELQLSKLTIKSFRSTDAEHMKRSGFILEGKTMDYYNGTRHAVSYWSCYSK